MFDAIISLKINTPARIFQHLQHHHANIFECIKSSKSLPARSCGRDPKAQISSPTLAARKNKIFSNSLLNFTFSRDRESEVMSRKKQS